MSDTHISFDMLSDFIDNEISFEEKLKIQSHMDSCRECGDEFQRLKTTVGLCAELRSVPIAYGAMQNTVLSKVRSRRRFRFMLRVVPAAAAVVLLVFGATLYNGSIVTTNVSDVIAENETAPVQTENGGIDQVIDVLRDNNAMILSVSDSYVEGKIPISKFEQMRKELGTKRIAFSVMEEPPAQGMNITKSNIEEVVSDDLNDNQASYRKFEGETFVRFKVFP